VCFRDYFAANSTYLLPPWQGGTIGSVHAPNGAAFKGGAVLFSIPEDLMCEGGKLWFRVLNPAN
jgi:hypothetical protein